MAEIELLNQDTIDKIAAGEVVERPASVVKELIENSIDANATIITVEIEKGGVSKIRVSDNGIGIPFDQVRKAFLRHSTSKLRDASELSIVSSLGFRGEALSSIAAVSKTELITKTADSMLGTHYEIEGAIEKGLDEIGAPNGSSFIVRDLFYNTLPRRKFLKSQKTENNYICDIVEKLALSHPDIAFQLSVDGKTKISTVGSGNLIDAVYQIYGKNIANNLLEIDEDNEFFKIKGYIGNSSLSKGNRSFENIFINNRYIKSKVLSGAVEEGYEGYLMQHLYPFFCLFIDIDTNMVDVNVHPTKMDVRIDNQNSIVALIKNIIHDRLNNVEDIRKVEAPQNSYVDMCHEADSNVIDYSETVDTPNGSINIKSVFDNNRSIIDTNIENDDKPEVSIAHDIDNDDSIIEPYEDKKLTNKIIEIKSEINNELSIDDSLDNTGEQISFLSKEAIVRHKIIGQLFDTYWLVEYDNNLYIIDQHAAHEKVLYERTLSLIKNKEMSTQQISPPVIVTLNSAEEAFLSENIELFNEIGYEIEHFGGHEYAINGIPYNIFGVDAKTLFMDMISDCTDITSGNDTAVILEKIASMSCKAAIKGNMSISVAEAKELIDELLELDNPFHCPHGRPTIIMMSKYEIEKKFGRIQ